MKLTLITTLLVLTIFPASAGSFSEAAIDLEKRIEAIEQAIPLIAKPMTAPSATNKTVVTVCVQGCDAATFKSAYDMVADGGVINVMPGAYNDCLIIKKSLTINGAGAKVSGKACGEKAAFVVAAGNVTITGFDIGPITGTEGNIACVRATEPASGLTLRGVKCHDTKMGVLVKVAGDVLIEDSSFRNFASNSANPHALYITEANRFTLKNSSVSNSNDAHLVKSGALSTLIENSVLASLDSKTSRLIDAYGGGSLTVRNSVLQVRNNTSLHFMNYASEAARLNPGPHVVLIEGNTFINDDARDPIRKFNPFRPVDPLVSPISGHAAGNRLVGKIGEWPAWITDGGTQRFATRAEAGMPAYDGTLASTGR